MGNRFLILFIFGLLLTAAFQACTSKKTPVPSLPVPGPAVTFTATPTVTPALWDISSGVTTLASGEYHFGCVHIGAGAVVTIGGGVTIFTQCFTLDAGATISGVGQGDGPGQGLFETCDWGLAGGGGHGGAGGKDCGLDCVTNCGYGGSANDDPIHPTFLGSSGAGWAGYQGGGGLLKLVVYDPIKHKVTPALINGTIDMDGNMGSLIGGHDGGGGAGGTILIEASDISGTGVLLADGGFTGQGGGGGGGIISLIANTGSFAGTISVKGGTVGGGPNIFPGDPGIISFTIPPVSGF